MTNESNIEHVCPKKINFEKVVDRFLEGTWLTRAICGDPELVFSILLHAGALSEQRQKCSVWLCLKIYVKGF